MWVGYLLNYYCVIRNSWLISKLHKDDACHCVLQQQREFPAQNIRKRAATPYRVPGDSVSALFYFLTARLLTQCCN